MTKRRSILSLSLLAAASLSACSVISKGKTSSGGGEPAGSAGPVLAGNMAEAPTYAVGATITAPAECHTSGYARIDAPVGEPFKLEVTVSAPGESCVSVSWLNGNGGSTGGLMEEVCTNESPATFDVNGMEGGSFLQISEGGVCVGATVTLAVK